MEARKVSEKRREERGKGLDRLRKVKDIHMRIGRNRMNKRKCLKMKEKM